MVALPPTQLPAQAQALPWLQSAAAMERVRPEAAGQAYATAVKAWPTEPAAWLGQGNAYYAQGRLAQVRVSQERWGEAAQAIERAVAVGGPRLARYRQLQLLIEEGLAVQASLKGRATTPLYLCPPGLRQALGSMVVMCLMKGRSGVDEGKADLYEVSALVG